VPSPPPPAAPAMGSDDTIGALGGGSDYAGFLNNLGIASADLGFNQIRGGGYGQARTARRGHKGGDGSRTGTNPPLALPPIQTKTTPDKN